MKDDLAAPFLIGYARVSTEEQNLDMQIAALMRAGVARENIYIEKVSTRRSKRPMLDRALRELRQGDVFVVWKLDRIARSRADLYARLDQINEAGAGLKSLTENFDFSSAIGKLVLGIFVLIAEFERDLISMRTTAGMKAMKERGGRAGRKQKFTPDLQEEAFKLMLNGASRAEAARACGVAPPTISLYFDFGVDAKGNEWVAYKQRNED
jgi:DNA invertase Pin-like site-specific DNA recombinase